MKKDKIAKLVKENVRVLRAYEAKEVPCTVKLDANESPYGFTVKGNLQPPSDLSVPGSSPLFCNLMVNRYPDPEAKALRKIVSKDFGVAPENILQGNGSDELIYSLIITFGGPVLSPVPTFSMYGIISQALGEPFMPVPLDSSFDIDLAPTLKAIRNKKPKIIFLSSPNNPTGNCFSADKILKILNTSKGIVVVDEAYQPFAKKQNFLPLLKSCRNLVVMRTLSKIGLAALRLGFIVADRDIIHEVNKVRLPFNVNALSQRVAVEILKKKKALHSAVRKITDERQKLYAAMGELQGVHPFPSDANFVLFRVQKPDIVYNKLARRGILIRNLDTMIKNCLRVTVGTPAENSAFLKALSTAVKE